MTNIYNPKRDTVFWSAIRATPFIYFIYGILNVIINPSFESIFYTIAYYFNFSINHILKSISKNIYSFFNTDYIFPFGQGSRPIGATNCATFAFLTNPKAISFGMPSGHSQLAWFFSTYFILNIWNTNKNNINKTDTNDITNTTDTNDITNTTDNILILRISFLILLAIIVSYSRVIIEGCHTTGQVITGGIIGIISGFIFYYIKKYILDMI